MHELKEEVKTRTTRSTRRKGGWISITLLELTAMVVRDGSDEGKHAEDGGGVDEEVKCIGDAVGD